MTFEFMIACRLDPDTSIYDVLIDLLSIALGDNQEDSDENTIGTMIEVKHQRFGDMMEDDDGYRTQQVLVGFTVELPELESTEAVIEEFSRSLVGSGPIYHAVMFENPLLREELVKFAGEIFALEMKLRRALSFVYLHAHRHGSPYDLFGQEQVSTMTRDLTERQMESVAENQLFHLTFGQYVQLNQRREPRLPELIAAIRDSEQYEVLRDTLTRSPIEDSGDIELLSDLRRLMDPIERMRNCVAHNRKPDIDTREDYSVARPQLEERLNLYLAGLELH